MGIFGCIGLDYAPKATNDTGFQVMLLRIPCDTVLLGWVSSLLDKCICPQGGFPDGSEP